MIFKLIHISMETICQKNENRLSTNFVRTRPVIEKLMLISKIKIMAREICKNKTILYVCFRIIRQNISSHDFCLMKLNGLKEEHYFNEIASKGTKMRIEVIL